MTYLIIQPTNGSIIAARFQRTRTGITFLAGGEASAAGRTPAELLAALTGPSNPEDLVVLCLPPEILSFREVALPIRHVKLRDNGPVIRHPCHQAVCIR